MDEDFYRLIPKKYSTKLRLNRSHERCIVLRHGHISITDYTMGDNREFEKALSVFDEQRWKYELKGGYYIPELKEFRINRGYNLESLAALFPGYKAKVENDAYPADKVDIKLLAPPRDDFQRVGLTFMCSQNEYHSNSRFTQQMIEANPGSGKTFMGVAVSGFMQARSVVFVPFEKLLKQWKNSYLTFTSLSKDEVLIVKGSKLCLDILDGKYKDVKAFIFSIETFNSFCDRYGNLETIELLRSLNCYIKIVDEVHRDMKIISRLEALSNFHMNYYMSASPGRSDKKENWIFKESFKNVPRFGSHFVQEDEKHINVFVKQYKFTPTIQQQGRMIQRRTKYLNTKSFERELIHAPAVQQESFVTSLRTMLKWTKKQLQKGNKVLILSETVDGTAFTQSIAEEIFPKKTSRYYGSMKEKDKEEALTYDVICATISSLGTGADISGIQFVHNITSYSNWIGVVQTAGRARKISDDVKHFYIEYVNVGFMKTLRQYEKRKPNLVKMAKGRKIFVVE